ncbi:MAG TPA: hypothetical protein VHG51_05430 [Longimicrobiaceae bacterium]|nr:hypothetical protein [Longimicrobiaceae bacterium]
MTRYGRDYGWQGGGYGAGGGFRGNSFYGQGGGYRARGGYDRGYEHGWGMEGLYDSITHGAGERGYGRDYRGAGRYDRDFYRRDYGAEQPRTPFGGTNTGGRSRFGSGYGGSERGEDWGGFGARRGYDRSYGQPRIDRSRYDRGWF